MADLSEAKKLETRPAPPASSSSGEPAHRYASVKRKIVRIKGLKQNLVIFATNFAKIKILGGFLHETFMKVNIFAKTKFREILSKHTNLANFSEN
jgi:hypothetical protein